MRVPGAQFLRMRGVGLLVVVVVILVSAPGARAASKFKTLYKFKGGADGNWGVVGPTLDEVGNVYGATWFGGTFNEGTVFKLTPTSNGSWEKSVIYSFCSPMNCDDGATPAGGLVLDAGGNLYGTTNQGGVGQFGRYGTVFKLTPNSDGTWAESVLYSFCSQTNCVDGASPQAILIFDQVGNLYGMTPNGGVGESGTVFKLAPNSDGTWTETVVYSFCSQTNCADGASPEASLVFDRAGNLYGTTGRGGNDHCNGGCGVVFKLTPGLDGSWSETVLYSFCSLKKCRDGSDPTASLTLDQSENLYGTTQIGGTGMCYGVGCGTVFELTPRAGGGWTEQILHSFRGSDGEAPWGGVTFDTAGNLYGTARFGGDARDCGEGGCGVVFKLAPNLKGGWSRTVLHYFVNHAGAAPASNLIFDASGDLYGGTNGDSFATHGSVFEITP